MHSAPIQMARDFPLREMPDGLNELGLGEAVVLRQVVGDVKEGQRTGHPGGQCRQRRQRRQPVFPVDERHGRHGPIIPKKAGRACRSRRLRV